MLVLINSGNLLKSINLIILKRLFPEPILSICNLTLHLWSFGNIKEVCVILLWRKVYWTNARMIVTGGRTIVGQLFIPASLRHEK